MYKKHKRPEKASKGGKDDKDKPKDDKEKEKDKSPKDDKPQPGERVYYKYFKLLPSQPTLKEV